MCPVPCELTMCLYITGLDLEIFVEDRVKTRSKCAGDRHEEITAYMSTMTVARYACFAHVRSDGIVMLLLT